MNALEFEVELPKGWVNTKLGNLVENVKKTNPKDMPDKLFYYCDINSIDNLQFKITAPKQFLGKDAPSRARQVIKHGDILFSTVRTYLKNIAIVPSDLDGQLASTGFCVLRPKQDVNNTFIFNYAQFEDFLSSLNSKQRGTSYPAVRSNDVLNSMILLPPLNEQRRIVSTIESIFAQIDAARESLERLASQVSPRFGNLAQLKRSVLKQAFEGKLVPQDPKEKPAEVFLDKIHKNSKRNLITDKNRLPKGWILSSVGQLYDIIGGGTPSTRIEKYWQGDISWISSADIYGLHDIRPRRKITHEAIKNSATNLVSEGSIIVVTRVGLGKIAKTKTPLCFSQDSQALVEKISFTHPDYMLYYLSQAVQLFKHISRGTTISGVTKKQLSQLPLPLPPLNEQRRIVSKIESIFSKIDATDKIVKNSLTRLDLLKKSVLKKAFEGKLVPQDPNDEPVSVLLKRIEQSGSGKSQWIP